MLPLIPTLTTSFILLATLWWWSFQSRQRRRRRQQQHSKSPKVFGFFHPYCSGGGGGERVLWKMIQVLQAQQHESEIVIYTIDPPSLLNEAQLRKDAERRFDVLLQKPVTLISLHEYKDYLLPSPFLSLVMESIGTMKLAYQALKRHQPDVFCDTTGCAFTFSVARWMLPPEAYIMAYVHYPTISTDMMAWEWRQDHRPKWKTCVKLIYYWMFAILYGLVGSMADVVMVNSTWTYNHIRSLWRLSKQIHIVYPPCRVPSTTTATTTNTKSKREKTIVSIGQFRPEKNHKLQVESLARLFETYPQHQTKDKVKLLLIGSCRNDADRQRVEELQTLVKQLDLTNAVKFSINPPYSELQQQMESASMGIHTMRQEHFGIGIVEMMAAGLLTIAHNSGGPQTDILHHGKTGYLATTVDDYANAIHQALTMKDPKGMRQRAQESATRFSDQVFDESFGKVLPLLSK